MRNKKLLIILGILFLASTFAGFGAQKSFKQTKKTTIQEKTTAFPTISLKYHDPNTAPVISDQEFKLLIGKLNIDAPIIANVDGTNEGAYLQALQGGVAHFAGTALPDKLSGNTVIFGHSSYYADKPGQYKTIFKSLNKLERDDQIEVHYRGRKYIYAIVDKQIVLPSDTRVLQPTADQQLTLITCWPIGSTAKRLVIIAKRTN